MKDADTRRLSVAPLETGTTGTVDPLTDGDLVHWQRHRQKDGVEWWLLDKANASTNTLSTDVLTELQTLVEDAASDRPAGIVLRSAKPGGFVAGADIGEFRDLTDPNKIDEVLQAGHALFSRIDALPSPTLCLIHGFCLGGGLELALVCRHRIARPDATFGFPEVQLGLHPGLGGTARLVRCIPPTEAVRMMLTGRNIDARRALRLGLIDAVVEERHFANAAQNALAGKLVSRRGRMKLKQAMNFTPLRHLVAYQSRKQTADRAPEAHYPAPYALIDLWQHHGANVDAMLGEERGSFAQLLQTETSRNLVRVFFLREALRSTQSTDSGIRHVHVIGAGTMGGDIGAWCAARGLRVTLEDREAKYIAPAVARARKTFERALKSSQTRRDAFDRLIPDLAGQGRRRADLIIEAVPENIELKQQIFRDVSAVMKPDAILATNTSSILLEALLEGVTDPSRFLGLHFFNPVPRMQLVELVTHAELDAEVLDRATSFVQQISRLPIEVASSPGFLVNRVLTPYLLEALALIDDGVPAERIDLAAEQFGMPMGPVELADQVGLDVCLHVSSVLHEQLDQPLYAIPDWVARKVEEGKLGEKSGEGLYKYRNGDAQKPNVEQAPDEALVDRLILPFLNTCVMCLGEGVVADADALDAAMIFATGFAPFRGGPLNYARTRGVAEVVAGLEKLAARHGERFTPSSHWQEFE